MSTRSRGEATRLDEDYDMILKDVKYPRHKYVAILNDSEDGTNFKIAKVSKLSQQI